MMTMPRVILLGVFAALLAPACGAPEGRSSSARVQPEAPCDLDEAHRAVYEAPLDEKFPPEQYAWLCEKALSSLEAEKWSEIGDANPAPVPSNPEEAAPPPEPYFYEEEVIGGERLQQEDLNPLIEARGDFNTLWRGVVGKTNVRVWAGSALGDADQGIVYVQMVDPVTAKVLDRWMLDTPTPGPVRISSARGSLLTLRSTTTDSLVRFDAKTREFQSS